MRLNLARNGMWPQGVWQGSAGTAELTRLRAEAVQCRRVVGQDAPVQRQLSPETRFDYGFTTDPTSNE